MTTTPPETPQQLRQRAEEQFRAQETATTETPTPEETQRILYDLRVHQIELEMQVDELRQKQQELDATRRRYFDLYDLAPVGYLTFSEKGLIREANLSAATMLGVTRTVLLQNILSKFIFPVDQDSYYLQHKRVIETGDAHTWEMRMLRGDGSPFWANLQAAPAHDGEYLVTFTDISERKKLEAEKLLLEQRLQQSQKLESLGVLAGGIAHDFNNILQIILGRCALIKMDYETAESFIPQIEQAAKRAAGLCNQMLAYAGKSTLARTQVIMWMLVDEIVSMLKKTIKQNVVINTNYLPDIPSIRGDADQLGQIVMNLIINAAEAIGTVQGEVRVSLAKTTIHPGQSDLDYNGKEIVPGIYACLEVSDNGCGMDEETKWRIFEPFYTTKFTGRGLGMSAVLGIVRSHMGALQLFSTPGQGTTIKVYLPAQASGSDGDVSVPQASLIPWQGNGTILLVEDEVQISLIAKTLLKRMGFEVLAAANGIEALELYQKHKAVITLVLTDIGMPVMDGYEMLRELKKLDPELPIVISSGFGEGEVTAGIEPEDIAGLVSKPYNPDQLRDVLKKVVEGHHVGARRAVPWLQ